jgi:hypothetical protein
MASIAIIKIEESMQRVNDEMRGFVDRQPRRISKIRALGRMIRREELVQQKESSTIEKCMKEMSETLLTLPTSSHLLSARLEGKISELGYSLRCREEAMRSAMGFPRRFVASLRNSRSRRVRTRQKTLSALWKMDVLLACAALILTFGFGLLSPFWGMLYAGVLCLLAGLVVITQERGGQLPSSSRRES